MPGFHAAQTRLHTRRCSLPLRRRTSCCQRVQLARWRLLAHARDGAPAFGKEARRRPSASASASPQRRGGRGGGCLTGRSRDGLGEEHRGRRGPPLSLELPRNVLARAAAARTRRRRGGGCAPGDVDHREDRGPPPGEQSRPQVQSTCPSRRMSRTRCRHIMTAGRPSAVRTTGPAATAGSTGRAH